MKKPPQKRSPHSPRSAQDDQPPIIQLTGRVKALASEVRALTGQHARWVEGVGRMMGQMDATATKLANMADELGHLDPGVYLGFEEFDF